MNTWKFLTWLLLLLNLNAVFSNVEDVVIPTSDPSTSEKLSSTKYKFESEISRLMNLIINSLYTNKEIFLREIISNANDAIAKIRFASLKNPELLDTHPKLGIWIKVDSDANTITVRDSGIGMTKEDLIKNLGTIAKSGTSDFLKKLHDSQGNSLDTEISSQIGQFGVGFYSSFLVSEKVVVISKNNDDEQYIWQSDSNEFSVALDPNGSTLGRGTAVIMHLNKQNKIYLNTDTIKTLIKKYSSFIDFPIYLYEKVEVDELEPSVELDDEEKEKLEQDALEDEEAAETLKTAEKHEKKFSYEYTHLNNIPPIWMRPTSNITNDEYLEFFRSLKPGQNIDYITKIHFVAEGDASFRALLFIPKKLPSTFMLKSDKDTKDNMNNIKLYVKRVFITSNTEKMFPHYLEFVSGIIDSDDLPLNVGRETLQQHQLMEVIKKKIVRKVLDSLTKLPEDEYTAFLDEFSIALKYGIIEDVNNKNRIMKMLRFSSSHSDQNKTTLTDYITRMPSHQTQLLYVSGDSLADCKSSPYAKSAINNGLEVLYMHDTIDEFFISYSREFEDKQFQNLAKSGLDLKHNNAIEAEIKSLETEYKPLISWFKKESSVKASISSIKVSVDMEPSCSLFVDNQGVTGHLEKILRAQSKQSSDKMDDSTSAAINKPKLLVINPFHPIIKSMLDLINAGSNVNSEDLNVLAESCMAIAKLNGGFVVDDASNLASLMQNNTLRSLGFDPQTVSLDISQKLVDIRTLAPLPEEPKEDSTGDEEDDDKDEL